MSEKRIAALLLALAVAAGALAWLRPTGTAAEAPRYEYVLTVAEDGADDGAAVLELYAALLGEKDAKGPFLDGGAFGLRFPDWVTAAFTPEPGICLRQMVPDEEADSGGGYEVRGTGYHAFGWTGEPLEDSEVIDAPWTWDETAGEWRLKLGTYTLTLPQEGEGWRLPDRAAVGLLDWTTVQEAGTSWDSYVWNPDTGLYQGYYPANEPETAEDALLTQTDIGFRFTPPESWPEKGDLLVLSYDPAKPVKAELYDSPERTVRIAVLTGPEWAGADSEALYAANGGQTAGTGPYFACLRLSEAVPEAGQSIESGETYWLFVSKQGHVTQALRVTAAAAGTLSGAEGLPEDGSWLYLPAGDLNGNGRIDMADRGALLGLLGRTVTEADQGELPLWRADIDGDGRVTQADLSILTSPMNYAKQTETEGEEADGDGT